MDTTTTTTTATPTRKNPAAAIGYTLIALVMVAAFGMMGWRAWQERHPADATPAIVYDFACDVTARIYGGTDTTWQSDLAVSTGDVVEVRLEYTNLSAFNQYDVAVWLELPEGVAYLAKSTALYNGSHPKGAVIEPDAITTDGIAIGDYAGHGTMSTPGTYTNADGEDQPAGANAVVCFALGVRDPSTVANARLFVRAGTEGQAAMTQAVIIPIHSATPTATA